LGWRKKLLRVKGLKMRIIKLSPEFLMERLQGKASSLSSNLPSGTELLDIKYDLLTRQVTAVIRSDSFEDTAETFPIPEFNLTYSTCFKPVPAPVAASPKPEANLTPAPTSKPEPAAPKKPLVPPKHNTGLMEEEFSQEQRKLLSFSVNGDFLVVKPVKFLKAEWDEINDVVRSLGGRWVKGDIISYWEIPLPQK
jgi:hypothetical protein